MRFNQSTDYALRVLMYLGLKGEKLATISEIAETYQISRNHLMKVIYRLGQAGFIHTQRGKNGGLRLERDASEISVGDVVRRMEERWDLVDCFGNRPTTCPIQPACTLQHVLRQGLNAFLSVLDEYSVADLLTNRAALDDILHVDLYPRRAPADHPA